VNASLKAEHNLVKLSFNERIGRQDYDVTKIASDDILDFIRDEHGVAIAAIDAQISVYFLPDEVIPPNTNT
jgi:hypothetical protein